MGSEMCIRDSDITVSNINGTPVAEAGTNQSVNEAVSVSLDGSASSDPDGDGLTFAWTQTAGTSVSLSDAAAAAPSFTAPTLTSNTPVTLTFQLIVNDGTVDSVVDTVELTVSNVNEVPTAQAGQDQTDITEATLVTLDGSNSSDLDGDVLTYSWTQTGAAPIVTLSDATAASPTFMAPAVADTTTLSFELIVNDGLSDSAPAIVSVTILENTAPTLTIADVPDIATGAFTASFTFSEAVTGFVIGDIKLLNASASAFEGSNDSYSAVITPTNEGVVTIDIPANVAQDLAGNGNLAADQARTQLDTIAPSVVLSGVSESIRGPFDLDVTFGEAVSGFTASDISLTNATASALNDLGEGAYRVTITPLEHGDVTLFVEAGIAVDAVGNENEASNRLRTNFIDENFVKLRTQGVVHNFMSRRADQITLNEPSLANRLLEQKTDGNLNGYAERGSTLLAFNGTATGTDAKLVDFIGADAAARLNLWTEASFARVNAETASNNLTLVHAGVDYRLNDDILLGVMGQFDWADEYAKTENFSASGQGWLVGPYLATRLTDTLVFDGRVAWGQSNNKVSPFRTYTDEFDANRVLLKGQLTGDFSLDDWRINPNIALIYFEETSEDYIDSLGINIASQEVSLGRVTFGPQLTKAFRANEELIISPSLNLRGIWDFETPGIRDFDTGLLSSSDKFRARFESGLIGLFDNGSTVKFDGFYDGIGAQGFEAYGLTLGFSLAIE